MHELLSCNASVDSLKHLVSGIDRSVMSRFSESCRHSDPFLIEKFEQIVLDPIVGLSEWPADSVWALSDFAIDSRAECVDRLESLVASLILLSAISIYNTEIDAWNSALYHSVSSCLYLDPELSHHACVVIEHLAIDDDEWRELCRVATSHIQAVSCLSSAIREKSICDKIHTEFNNFDSQEHFIYDNSLFMRTISKRTHILMRCLTNT